MEPWSAGPRITPQAVIGLVLLLAGVLLTLDNLELVETQSVLRFWPLGIVAAGALRTLQSADNSGRVFGGLIMLVGLIWTGEFTFGLPVSIDDLWPIGLIALGVVILARARRGAPPAASADAVIVGDTSVTEVAVWAGKQRRNTSPVFRRGDLTAVMGGVELDLRGAGTATGEAIIDVFVIWGGIDIFVPPDWAVSNQVFTLMGAAEDHSAGTQDARHRLIVRGVVVMGGLEIKT